MTMGSSSEYSVIDVLSVLSRIWILLLILPAAAGLGVGYWAYSAQNAAQMLQVESVISLPSVDRAVIDLPGLFASTASGHIGSDASRPQPAPATVRADDLGDTYQGTRRIVRLVVQSSSGAAAERSLQAFIERLAAIVDLRNAEPEANGRIDSLQARIDVLTGLWDRLAASDALPAGSDATTANLRLPIRALASASVVGALATLENQLDRARPSAAATALRIEIPPGLPTPVPASGNSRWIRLPIAAAVGAGFVVLLSAFAIDGIRRAREATRGREANRGIGKVHHDSE